MKLYHYFRSGTSFRVRIALNLKGLAYDDVSVHLGRGEHRGAAYQALSADGLVPLLEVNSPGAVHHLGQSMAIIEYLDECHPEPPLLPADPLGRARVRALAQTVACEIHPINNMRVLQYLSDAFEVSDTGRAQWYNHWVSEGLHHYERRLSELHAERLAAGLAPALYSYGDQPTLADCCLIPQIVNGQRYGLSVESLDLPLTWKVFKACMSLDAFVRALPEHCRDAQ